MFKVSDLSPDHISNYAPDEVYSDIENLMEDEGTAAYYLQQIKQGNNIKWARIESHINLDRYDEIIMKLSSEWSIEGLKTLKDTTYTIFSATLKSKEAEIESKSESQQVDDRAVEELMYIIKQFDEYIRRVHEQNMSVLKSYLPASRQGWWTEPSPYAQFISDIGKMFHDLATVLSLILEEIKGAEKLQPYKDIVDELQPTLYKVEMYASGSTINLQASTGHSVKIMTSETKIEGHIGDHAPIPDIDAQYRKSINRNKGKMKELIKTLALIIEQEQLIRVYISDIDRLVDTMHAEARTDDAEAILRMIQLQSGEQKYENLQGYYEQIQSRAEKINAAWNKMMEHTIELQKYLTEPLEIKYQDWVLTLLDSSFSSLFKEILELGLV